MIINGFLSKNDEDAWIHTQEPITMENSKGDYIIITLEDFIDEKEGVKKVEPQFVSASKEQLIQTVVLPS